ncbi:RAD9, HUS1, RAD1-interacting nuclear orphan protein 1 [Betta splendens]|uniref:RAD9, HUS1, RAD1-interacting nuclear orphan protein 1 n=1 Tax=Betta splendens TaxID=158456 RepID=A0A6P7NJL4_BETSP|nr:RAD9, HUS1, RAD1-interacting nuclear orphan protein 1 [Betta splendens]
MPRKVTKTEKPSLQFLERPLCGARLQNVPEVRAALNPREFITEAKTQNRSALSSWVSPQFDSSLAVARPVKRGRRKCQSATSITDNCSKLSRKSSVCKFPSLSFHRRTREQTQQSKRTCTKKATASAVVSDKAEQAQGSSELKKTVSNAHFLDTPKRQPASIRKRNAERISGGGFSSSGLPQPKSPPIQLAERCRISTESVSTPAPIDTCSADPPPDVDTPEALPDRINSPSLPFVGLHSLLVQPCTPPHNQPPDLLVTDTPESIYGLKVTWRRRRGLMLSLKERGHLSDSDVVIHS